jgi:hypothetical protein
MPQAHHNFVLSLVSVFDVALLNVRDKKSQIRMQNLFMMLFIIMLNETNTDSRIELDCRN